MTTEQFDSLIWRVNDYPDELINTIVYSIPDSVIQNPNATYLDLAMGGGQFLQVILKRCVDAGHSKEQVLPRLYGFERSVVYLNYARWKRNLQGANLAILKPEKDLDSLNMKFDVIVGNPPYTKSTVRDRQSTGGCSGGLDNLFFEKCMELAPYVSLIVRSKHFSKKSSKFRRNLFKTGHVKSIQALPSSFFPTISLTETCIVTYDQAFESETLVTFQGCTKQKIKIGEDTCVKLTNPDYIPEVVDNLAYRYQRGNLNLNQLEEGEYPMVITMGAKGKEMIIRNVPETQAICGKNCHGVVMNSKYGGKGFGKVFVKPFSYAVSGSSIILKTSSENESKLLRDYLLSEEIQMLAIKNKISNANTKELFSTIPDLVR